MSDRGVLDKEHADLLYEEAVELDAEGKTDEAIESYKAAIKLWPSLPLAHYNLGVNLAAMGRVDQAIRCWRRAVWLKGELLSQLATALGLDDEASEILV